MTGEINSVKGGVPAAKRGKRREMIFEFLFIYHP